MLDACSLGHCFLGTVQLVRLLQVYTAFVFHVQKTAML